MIFHREKGINRLGHRANYIIVTEESYELYYSHWALSLPFDLFWGPEYSLAFIREHEQRDRDHWLDEVWAEGGAVVDPLKKVLLLFGGEELEYNYSLRNIYLKLMKEVWQDWKIEWADEGILELADYVSYPRNLLENHDTVPIKIREVNLNPPTYQERIESVGSIVTQEGKLQLYPLDQLATYYLQAGPSLLGETDQQIGYSHFDYAKWSDKFPESGFHIDIPQQTIHYWSMYHTAEMYEKIQNKWLGWTIIWNDENYETQLTLTSGKLTFPIIDRQKLYEKIAEDLLLGSLQDPCEGLWRILRSSETESIYINPSSLQHHSPDLSDEQKKEIYYYAINQVKKKHHQK